MKVKGNGYLLTVLGVLLLGTGLVLMMAVKEPQGILRALPYVCIGIGSGVLGHGVGIITSRRALKNSPALARRMEIEAKDERNVAIGNRAKAKAFDMMLYVFGALLIAFALMGVDLSAVLILVAAYLFVLGYGLYYRLKFDKEM